MFKLIFSNCFCWICSFFSTTFQLKYFPNLKGVFKDILSSCKLFLVKKHLLVFRILKVLEPHKNILN